ncbi:MAG TPA: hypothetical protein VGD76_12390 [Ramlibacter sp.]
MKTAQENSPHPAGPARRGFTWSVRTEDIPFMRADSAETAVEGCSTSNCDCGCGIARFDRTRREAAVRGGQAE